MLQVRHLSTGYGKKQVLFDVSLTVKAGEISLLIGPNGSGKSTLLKAVYGLLPLFEGGSGEIIFGGECITHCPPFQLIRRGLVYIPQKNNCFENLTVKENLEVSTLSLSSNIARREALQRSLAKLPLLQEHLTKYPYQLSGGQRQLLALGMALTHCPKMLLLDEPFAGLSTQSLGLIRDQLIKLNKILGITILVAEHRVSEIVSLSDSIILLKLGRKYDISPASELENTDFTKMYTT